MEDEKEWRSCLQCNSDFYLKEVDKEFFVSRNLELPKRCWKCRKQNKNEAIASRLKKSDDESVAKLRKRPYLPEIMKKEDKED